MAPQQPLPIIYPPSWERSTATTLALSQLVAGGQLAANVDGQPPEWIIPSEKDRVPNPPYGYIVSFTRFQQRGFTPPASRFLRGLCYHYGVELQNFAPNAISQVATFAGVCEGFLCALGGHVSRRMRRALHLGVQKALSVVRSHYEVNFEAVASGYVIPEDVEDEAAMEKADALAADAAEALTETFTEFLFPDADEPQA
jgi:hypothetical protein